MVFSRSPEPGKVKTRLIPVLGVQGALSLYQAMLTSVLELCATLDSREVGFKEEDCNTVGCNTELWIQGDLNNPFILQTAQRFAFPLRQQQGNNLGESMADAFGQALKNYHKVIVIGGDCVSLDALYFKNAFAALTEHDVVIGPAEDGGYVLLGFRASPQLTAVYSKIFQEIEWGKADVYQHTRAQIAAVSLSYHVLDTRWDVDSADDLKKIRHHPRFSHVFIK